MSIEIKNSKKPINYTYAIRKLEKKVEKIIKKNNEKELIWFLQHTNVFTAGVSFKKNEILDKNIKIVNTRRGGKLTWHGPGQLICYLIIDLKKRNKDIRKFINNLESSIIETLKKFKINTFADKKNIGIWYKKKDNIVKIGSIGIRVKRWIAYHGFSINISNKLDPFQKIIPCGITNKKIDKINNIKKINYDDFIKYLQNELIKNLKV